MRKIAFLIGVVVVVVVGLTVAAPYGLGVRAEANLRESAASLDQSPLYNFKVLSYQKGWLSSSARVEVGLTREYARSMVPPPTAGQDAAQIERLRDMLAEPVPLVVDLAHGPLVFDEGAKVALFSAAIRLDEGAARVAELHEELGVSRLFEMRSRLLPGGRIKSRATVAPFEMTREEGHLRFSGLNLESAFMPGDEFTIRGESESLALTVEDGSGLITRNLSIRGDFKPVTSMIWSGPGEIRIETIELNGVDGSNVALADAGMRFDSTLSDDAQRLDISGEYFLDSLMADEVHLRDASLAISMRHVPVTVLESYSALVERVMVEPADSTSIQSELRALADALVRASPTVEIGPVRFTNNERPFRADVRIDVDGGALPAGGVATLEDPNGWIALISAEGTSEIDKGMANEMAVDFVKMQLRANVDTTDMDKPEVITQIDTMAEQQGPLLLRSFVQRGLLNEAEELYSTRFSFADGALTVNGVAMSIAGP